MSIEELQPEIIDENYVPQEAPLEPETALEPEQIEGVPEDTTSPMPEEMEALKEELNKDIDNFLVKFGALKQGENKIVESFKKKTVERDENDKVEKETRKNADKETKSKHKEELKAKDAEIKDLKKVIAQKEKEVAKLHKQVKEALYAEE